MSGTPPPPKNTRWQKGFCPNPKGRPKLPPELRKVSLHTTDEIKRTISKHFRMTRAGLDAVLSNPDSPALDLIIAKTIETSIKKGNIAKAEYLFMRLVGRVTEKIEIEHPEPVVIQRANGEQMVLDAVLADGDDNMDLMDNSDDD